VINCLDDNIRVELGKSSPDAGKAALKALDCAVKDLKEGKIDVLVTGPINKDNIQSEDFDFPGHTEYLTQHFGQNRETLMLMVSDLMKVGVVTGHIPLKQVPEVLTQDLILRKLRIMDKTLLQDFKIRKPRIAVFGLNPHASDGGLMGDEENNIIIPAIQRAKEEDIMAFGPYPADGFFGSDNIKKFDGILAMYHDQGLAPFKAISFDEGVNFTAGLDIIRTSPDHGTAYELAGQGEASPKSFRNALFLALDVYRNRKEYEELSSNPLESHDKSDI
jgi:4-hydroxythreonine-4-phosphate dehydrogenase